MPRRASIPKYALHKASGQAVCYVNRKPKYLGPYNSPESRRKYGELLAELATAPSPALAEVGAAKPAPITVSGLILKFAQEELPRFSPSEQLCQRASLRVLRQFFGETLAADFGPLRLRTVREAMVSGDANQDPPRKPWSRQTVNRQCKRIQALFRWGAELELIPPMVYQALLAMRVLKRGETSAHESRPREAVPKADLDAVRLTLKECHRDLLDLLLATGARPGELLSLTTSMIDRTGEVWRADLTHHKSAHKGKRRVLFFNATARAILPRHFKEDVNERLFRIRRDSFCEAIARACRRAKVSVFCPHMLRHTAATTLVDTVGLEAAQHVLGHSSAAMTLHYSRRAEAQASDAVKTLG